MPPGISRVIDPGQPQLRQQNEQAMRPEAGKVGSWRCTCRLQKYRYGYAAIPPAANVCSCRSFARSLHRSAKWRTFRIHRLGSDYRSNYYEYEIPLTLTPHGEYNRSTVAGCLAVWPKDNNLDIDLSVLTNVKKARNRLKNISNSGISYAKVYSEYDPDKPSQ